MNELLVAKKIWKKSQSSKHHTTQHHPQKDLLKKSLFNLSDVEKAGKETISAGYVSGVDDLSFKTGNQYTDLRGKYSAQAGKSNLVRGSADKAYDESVDMLSEAFERRRGSLFDSYTKQISDFDLSIESQKDNINSQITSADYQIGLSEIEKDQWYPFKYTGKVIDMFTGQYQST